MTALITVILALIAVVVFLIAALIDIRIELDEMKREMAGKRLTRDFLKKAYKLKAN